tara:strand:- start:2007 stop:2747 length:741 start_codon:yes stop_codon:yes gene_type:complete
MINNRYGIINYGNNCYLNAIIQLFLSHKETSNIINEYLDIENNLIYPKKLLDKLKNKLNINIQNDSQEVFILILDIIPELEKYFNNEVKNTFKCLECNSYRHKKDTFSTFFVHTESLENSVIELIKNENYNLECDKCKMTTNTNKVCNIKKLGEILIFYNVLKQKLKISENIKYSNKKYKLTGLIKHYGSQSSGHYIFIDYLSKLVIDDTNISPISNISLSDIYLLFYTLETTKYKLNNNNNINSG